MIDARGQDQQIPLLDRNADPLALLIILPDIEIARAVNHKPDLLVLVQVLLKEDFELLGVHVGAHGGGGDFDRVPVLVFPLNGNVVEVGQSGGAEKLAVEDADGGEVGFGDGGGGEVGGLLGGRVGLVVVVGFHGDVFELERDVLGGGGLCWIDCGRFAG